jgi:hypothetical protein
MMAATIKIAKKTIWLRVEIFFMSPQSRSCHQDAGDLIAGAGEPPGSRAGANLACTSEQPVNYFAILLSLAAHKP